MVKFSAVAALSAAALLASITPALAENKGPISPEVVALMATQDKLHKVADRIERSNGFSGFYVDAGSKTLNVYWKGTVPAKVRTEAVAARAQGLTVKIHPAKFSQAELKAEAARLVKISSVSSVAAKYDGSGLAVKQNAGISARSAIESSVPLDVEAGGAELAASRLIDTPPYKGGAYIENWAGGVAQGSCSSGFAVVDNATNADKLLTAAHCGSSNSYFYNGDLGYIGAVETRTVASDSETINATGQARVWIGESIQTEQNQFGLDVIGSARTLAGDWLCDSGAFSGTICQIRAEQTGISINFSGFGTVNNLVQAVHNDGYSAGGNGDSGGPVFSVQPGDKLVARGTLTAISTLSSDIRQCSGVPAGNGRQCSRRIFFPDISVQLQDHNARIKTVS